MSCLPSDKICSIYFLKNVVVHNLSQNEVYNSKKTSHIYTLRKEEVYTSSKKLLYILSQKWSIYFKKSCTYTLIKDEVYTSYKNVLYVLKQNIKYILPHKICSRYTPKNKNDKVSYTCSSGENIIQPDANNLIRLKQSMSTYTLLYFRE